jgi:REP element-mobilizing transposase RayT
MMNSGLWQRPWKNRGDGCTSFLCGYVLMPDHWHALIWTGYLLTISRVVQNIKWISASWLNGARRPSGSVWQRHQKSMSDGILADVEGVYTYPRVSAAPSKSYDPGGNDG